MLAVAMRLMSFLIPGSMPGRPPWAGYAAGLHFYVTRMLLACSQKQSPSNGEHPLDLLVTNASHLTWWSGWDPFAHLRIRRKVCAWTSFQDATVFPRVEEDGAR
jgi:hypothetical protein